MTDVRLVGVVSQGAPIAPGGSTSITLPAHLVDDRDIVLRAGTTDLREFGIEAGDILIVEERPDGRAATEELVLAALGDRAFIGRWWTKHGRTAPVDGSHATIAEDPQLCVLGAITVIARFDARAPERN